MRIYLDFLMWICIIWWNNTLVGTFYDNDGGGQIKDKFTITKSEEEEAATADNNYYDQIVAAS